MTLIFDTETTGLPAEYNRPYTATWNWPRIVQIAYAVFRDNGEKLAEHSHIIRPDGYTIPAQAAAIHGIDTLRAMQEGISIRKAVATLRDHALMCDTLVAHNMGFDYPILMAELYRLDDPLLDFLEKKMCRRCTKELGTNFCAIPATSAYYKQWGSAYKWPNLGELYNALFGCDFDGAHSAGADMRACADCYFEMLRRGIIPR